VQHDEQRRRQIGRQRANEIAQCFDAARRRADDNDVAAGPMMCGDRYSRVVMLDARFAQLCAFAGVVLLTIARVRGRG
jgi:hypothetical protein